MSLKGVECVQWKRSYYAASFCVAIDLQLVALQLIPLIALSFSLRMLFSGTNYLKLYCYNLGRCVLGQTGWCQASKKDVRGWPTWLQNIHMLICLFIHDDRYNLIFLMVCLCLTFINHLEKCQLWSICITCKNLIDQVLSDLNYLTESMKNVKALGNKKPHSILLLKTAHIFFSCLCPSKSPMGRHQYRYVHVLHGLPPQGRPSHTGAEQNLLW